MNAPTTIHAYVSKSAARFEVTIRESWAYDSITMGRDLAETIGRTVLLKLKNADGPIAFIFDVDPRHVVESLDMRSAERVIDAEFAAAGVERPSRLNA